MLHITIKKQNLSKPPISASTVLTGIFDFGAKPSNNFSVVCDCRELRMFDGAYMVFAGSLNDGRDP